MNAGATKVDSVDVSEKVVTLTEKNMILNNAEFCLADLSKSWSSVEIAMQCENRNITHVFWVAGYRSKKRLVDYQADDLKHMIDTHLTGPIDTLRMLLRAALSDPAKATTPIHLVVISSLSAVRLNPGSTLYSVVKAAQSAFAVNYAAELAEMLPGSKTTLVEPGRIASGFFRGSDRDTSNYMSAAAVAEMIWREMDGQTKLFDELLILKNKDGTPRLERGPVLPERPA